jgi:hypothetical protein
LIAARAAMPAGSSGGDLAGKGGTSTLLGDAQPFEYAPNALSGDVMDIAARGVSEAHEAECDALYEMRMTYCRGLSAMSGGDPRTYAACSEQAFRDYQTCRGY